MSHNLSIRLDARTDSQGKKYHIGRLKGPFTLDFKDGLAILVFTADDGQEEIQFAPYEKREKIDQ